MDDEIIGFCKKKSPEDRHRSVTFCKVAVSKDLFRKIVEVKLLQASDKTVERFHKTLEPDRTGGHLMVIVPYCINKLEFYTPKRYSNMI